MELHQYGSLIKVFHCFAQEEEEEEEKNRYFVESRKHFLTYLMISIYFLENIYEGEKNNNNKKKKKKELRISTDLVLQF